MQKNISILLLLLIFELNASSQIKPKQTDLEIFGLKGKVKSVTGTSWFIDDGVEKDKTEIESLFNESGFLTSQVKTYSSGKKNFLKCDGKGNPTELTDVNTNKTIYTQDAKGNTILEDNFAPEDGGKVKYLYDDNNNLIEKDKYDNADELTEKTTYKYDSMGNQIEYAYYLNVEDDGPSEKETYDYDIKGNKTETDYYEYAGLVSLTYYSYNTNGDRVSSKEVGASGGLINADSLVWNEHHNLIYFKMQEGEITDAAITIYNYEYEYDTQGNWIKKTTYTVDGKVRTATEGASMEIVYY